ncbi:MAG TPA: NAD(P)/FAD-dependent oxidoreductase [Pyrinomonadaceae bacterium]|nr:NAD(P)/FAD-dependent oxidoreductase [Pyrinomonadaceae bacterium]
MKSFDVVIIGAGLAGLQCAKLLSRQGAKILLVDRKRDLTKGVHTTGIFVRKTLEDFDFPTGTLGKPVRNVTLYSPKLRAINLESEKDEFRVGKMGLIYENFLNECVENGVEFSNETRYISAETSKSETIVRLERNGKSFEIKTRVLIGADGANSRVARDLKLDENKEWIVGYEEVFHTKNSNGEPRLHCFLDAKLAPGYLAWIADDGEEIHIGVGGYAAGFNPREALKEFKEKIAGEIIDLKTAELAETRGGRIPVGGILRRIANENGLLIGDAAGAVSPLTAGGLDPCLRLSKFAANIVWERLRTDNPQVLLQFSGELFRARFVSRLWMRRIIKTFANQRLLELGCLFMRGRIGQKFARHVFFGRGSFPDVEIGKSECVAEVV